MIDSKVKKAFGRIENIITEEYDLDDNQDLIDIGTALGMSEEEMKADYPNLYKVDPEEEDEDEDEEDLEEEEEKEEDEEQPNI